MKVRLIVLAAFCVLTFLHSAQAQDDITVLKQKVLFNNKTGDEEPALMRVNFNDQLPAGQQYSVCLIPNDQSQTNGPSTACPVFKFPRPQCFTVTKPGPHKFSLILKSNSSVGHAFMNCALTYSLVLLGHPPNYFGNPEIGVAYRLR